MPRAAPPGPDQPRAVDVLDAIALQFTDGYAAGRASAEAGRGAASCSGDQHWRSPPLAARRQASQHLIAMELWDFDLGYALTVRQVQVARDTGALVQLRLAIQPLVLIHSC
jgi:hypothetical protein